MINGDNRNDEIKSETTIFDVSDDDVCSRSESTTFNVVVDDDPII